MNPAASPASSIPGTPAALTSTAIGPRTCGVDEAGTRETGEPRIRAGHVESTRPWDRASRHHRRDAASPDRHWSARLEPAQRRCSVRGAHASRRAADRRGRPRSSRQSPIAAGWSDDAPSPTARASRDSRPSAAMTRAACSRRARPFRPRGLRRRRDAPRRDTGAPIDVSSRNSTPARVASVRSSMSRSRRTMPAVQIVAVSTAHRTRGPVSIIPSSGSARRSISAMGTCLAEDAQCARIQRVAAQFRPRKAVAIEQLHTSAAAREDDRGQAPRRTGADDDDVTRHQAPAPSSWSRTPGSCTAPPPAAPRARVRQEVEVALRIVVGAG